MEWPIGGEEDQSNGECALRRNCDYSIRRFHIIPLMLQYPQTPREEANGSEDTDTVATSTFCTVTSLYDGRFAGRSMNSCTFL